MKTEPEARPPEEVVLQLAAELEELSPTQREFRLAGPPVGVEEQPWRSVWRPLLEHLFKDETEGRGSSVLELLTVAEAGGLPRERAKEAVGRLSSLPRLQTAWEPWMEVRDREELRLRLEVLRHARTLSEGLAPFVFFFFRASDPLLYQTAALTLGAHLSDCGNLREDFCRYAGKRRIDLSGPIVLNNQRSRRRALLALTGLAVKCGQTSAPPPEGFSLEPFLFDRWKETLGRPSDLSAAMLSAEILLSGGCGGDAVRESAGEMLAVFAAAKETYFDRSSVQRWGRLMRARALADPSPGADWCVGVWWRLVENLAAECCRNGGNGFARRVRKLNALDEALRTPAFVPLLGREVGDAELSFGDGDGGLAAFCLLRMALWARREHSAADSELTAQAGAIACPEELAWLKGAMGEPDSTAAGGLFGDPAENEEAAAVRRLLVPLRNYAAWRSLSIAERALVAFGLLDLSQHGRLSADRWAGLLEETGISSGESLVGGCGQEEVRCGKARVSDATVQILLRLLSWDDEGGETFLESRMLHQMEDPRLLLALLPEERRSDLLPILADAFEHRIRMQLVNKAGFSVPHFLFRTLVRHPHVSFYQHLRQVCLDRTYSRAGGETVPVLEILDWLIGEKRFADDVGEGEFIAEYPDYDDTFLKGLRKLRERLSVPSMEEGPGRAVACLADWSGADPLDSFSQAPTLLALLGTLNEADSLCRSGYPVFEVRPVTDLFDELHGRANRLIQTAARLEPETLDALDESRDAIFRIEGELRVLEARLSPMLPEPEERFLERRIRELCGFLDEWFSALEGLHREWTDLPPDGEEDRFPWWSALLDRARAADGEGHDRFTELLWRTLRTACREEEGGELSSWESELRLLSWGLGAWPGGGAADEHGASMRERLFELWCELATEAMDAGYESRVSALLEEAERGGLSPKGAGDAEFLRNVKGWLLTRYRVGDTARVLRLARGEKGVSSARVAVNFFTHFSTMWVALVMGAFFMLDFGDAWAAMADPEIADVRGISLSFIFAIGAAGLYIYFNLRQSSRPSPGEKPRALWRSQLVRAGGFTAACAVFSLCIVTLLWWLLSRTDEVVHGPWAIGHIVAWSAFAIFIGVFLGLLAGHAMRGKT